MVQNAPKPRGRPRSFDEAEALEKATQVFWSKGYDGVTIDDLVDGMGVGRPSLYAVFGDKRAIFLRVLEAYAETQGRISREGTPLAADTSRLARWLFEVRRRKRDRERLRSGLPGGVRRAACGRRGGSAVSAEHGHGRRGAGGRPFPGRRSPQVSYRLTFR